MQLPSSGLVGWIMLATIGPAPADVTPPLSPRLEEFRAARVEVVGFDEAAVLAALRLRLPRLAVERHGGPPPSERPHVYVQVERREGDGGHIRAITSDGRAYDRSFTIEVGQEVRVVASTAANLLYSIEQGAVAPVQEDVAIPGAIEPAPDEPALPDAPVSTPPAAAPEPPSSPVKREPPPPVVAPPGWELAAGLHGAAILAAGPPRHGGVFGGGGGGVTLAARSPRGALLAIDLRGLGNGTTTFATGRLRVAIAGGYAWRRGRFELPVLLGLTIEPWWTTQSGATATIYSDGAVARRAPLIGGVLQVAPALRLTTARGPLAAVRIGPRIDVAGSFAVDDKATLVGLIDATTLDKQRLGGLELGLGLEVALQGSLRRRRNP